MLATEQSTYLDSPLPGVSSHAWTAFVAAMAQAPLESVSPSNALGMFELLPRRLADLGLVGRLKRVTKNNRSYWTGKFVVGTSDAFLKSPRAQYTTFCQSMRDYFDGLCEGKIVIGEADLSELSIAGTLAILHRAGPQGLRSWVAGNRFSATEKLVESVQGVF